MTEQQEHLSNLIQQRQSLSKELENIQGQAVNRRELLLKVQGAIEYLQQIGVTLPEPEVQVEQENDVTED